MESASASAFKRPIVLLPREWRLVLWAAMMSSSTIMKLPTPPCARILAMELPREPQPRIATRFRESAWYCSLRSRPWTYEPSMRSTLSRRTGRAAIDVLARSNGMRPLRNPFWRSRSDAMSRMAATQTGPFAVGAPMRIGSFSPGWISRACASDGMSASTWDPSFGN